jgi:hypothetical protein
METIKEMFSNLPLDKLTSKGVLIIAILLIMAGVITTIIKRKADKVDINGSHLKIKGSGVGNIKGSDKNKSIRIKLESSNIENSEIGCISNGDKNKK